MRIPEVEKTYAICQRCHLPPDWRGLQTHHITHKGMGGRHGQAKVEIEKDSNKIKICGKCHSRAHGIVER